MKRGPCIDCGKPGEHGHHENYSKPLDVVWFCRAHHIEHHRLERLYGRGQSLFSFFVKEGGL
jgi:hypothetical protein